MGGDNFSLDKAEIGILCCKGLDTMTTLKSCLNPYSLLLIFIDRLFSLGYHYDDEIKSAEQYSSFFLFKYETV
eukprot:scaffold16432_cov49-Cyclotella_meneghiniana.AAC.4